MLYFPCSAHRLQAHAGHHQLTHHPPSVSVLAPLHSKFPQMRAELHSWSIQRPCVSHTAAQGSEAQRRSRGTRGCGKCRGGQQHHTPYLSWQCKRGTAANERNNIQAVLHSVVTAAWLFICVPPSEEEAAPIGSRCERKDRQQPD